MQQAENIAVDDLGADRFYQRFPRCDDGEIQRGLQGLLPTIREGVLVVTYGAGEAADILPLQRHARSEDVLGAQLTDVRVIEPKLGIKLLDPVILALNDLVDWGVALLRTVLVKELQRNHLRRSLAGSGSRMVHGNGDPIALAPCLQGGGAFGDPGNFHYRIEDLDRGDFLFRLVVDHLHPLPRSRPE